MRLLIGCLLYLLLLPCSFTNATNALNWLPPLTTQTQDNRYKLIQVGGISLQPDTFYRVDNPLKSAYFPVTITSAGEQRFFQWSPWLNTAFDDLPFETNQGVSIDAQSTTTNQMLLSHHNENISLMSRFLHDDGYKQHTDRNLFNFAFSAKQGEKEFVTTHYLFINSIEQNDMTYLPGQDAYKNKGNRKINLINKANNNAHQLVYLADIAHHFDADKLLQLTPYFRFNQTDALLDQTPGLPSEKSHAASIGIHSSFNRTYAKNIDLTTRFHFDYTYGDYNEQQKNAYSQRFPAGRHYDFSAQTLWFHWGLLAEQFYNEQWSTYQDIGIDKSHYFYNNKLNDGSACQQDSTHCFYYRPNQEDLNYFTWTPKIGAQFQWADEHRILVNLYHRNRQLNSLDLYRLQNKQPIKSIKPEQTNAAESVLMGKFNHALHYHFLAYYRRINHVILSDYEGVKHYNQSINAVGVDSQFSWQPLESLAFTLGASYTDTQYRLKSTSLAGDAIDNQVMLIPRTQGFIDSVWHYSSHALAGIKITHQGKYYLDNANTLSYPGHELIDVYWQHNLYKKVTLRAAIENLTNEAYALAAESTIATAQNPNAVEQYSVGLGRVYSLGLSFNY
ncbi:MAG: hypothetical protein OXE99_15320 [Cellvibrionales bacterium]|nr:hypothetical protein [Cellvibrionales bacterium]